MIWGLVQRDPAVRRLPYWTVAGLMLGVILSAMIRIQPPAEGAAHTIDTYGLGKMIFIVWLCLGLFLGSADVPRRCARLDLGLPIPARRLWFARTLATVLGGAVLLAIAIATSAGVNAWRGVSPWLPPAAGAFVMDQAIVLLLAVALLRAYRPAQYAIEERLRSLLGMLLLWLALLGWLYLLRAWGPAARLVTLAGALLLLAGTYRALPPSFALAADRPGNRALPARGLPFDRAPRRAVSRILARTFLLHWGFVITAPVIIVIAIYHADYSARGLNGLAMLPFIWAVLHAVAAMPLARVLSFEPLPLPRRLLFHWLVLPGFALALASFFVATLLLFIQAEREPMIVLGAPDRNATADTVHIAGMSASAPDWRKAQAINGHSGIRVPYTFWDVAPADEATTIVSPWGERQPITATPIARGSRTVFFSPFQASVDRSPRFVAWQLSRAIERVYGRQIAPDSLRRRLLLETEAGGTRVRPEIGAIRDAYPELRATAVWARFPVMVALIGAPWLLLLIITISGMRAGASALRRSWGGIIAAVVSVGGLLGMIIASSNGQMAEWQVAVLARIWTRQLAAWLPGPPLADLLVALFVVAALYWLAARQFERSETPATRPAA